MMPDRLEERGSAGVTHGQQGDFIIEINKPLHNDSSRAGASAFLRNVPRLVDIRLGADDALAVSGRTHDGLDDAGDSDLFDRGFELLFAVGETVS